jgi:DNA repair photolyase
MSIPTLQNRLARIYEPNAPAPTLRLATLRAAKEHGLHVYAAVAPTYPECDENDLRATLSAIAELDPVTIYSEPVNIRADNTQRIAHHAAAIGQSVDLSVFATPESWQRYATAALRSVERIAADLGLQDKLHLWPDAALGTAVALKRVADPLAHEAWLKGCWAQISRWPSASGS